MEETKKPPRPRPSIGKDKTTEWYAICEREFKRIEEEILRPETTNDNGIVQTVHTLYDIVRKFHEDVTTLHTVLSKPNPSKNAIIVIEE